MATVFGTQVRIEDQRIVFNASWDVYQALARAVGDQPVRLSYDGERVELMSPGARHEEYKMLFDLQIRALAAALGIACRGMGSTRWMRPEVARGIESDTCYYFDANKLAVARRRPADDADWPLPDLAVEVDMSPNLVDRPSIYAALRIPEVWRFDGEVVHIDRLGADGMYAEVPESAWLGIRAEEIAPLLEIDAEDDNDFSNKVRDWARNVLVPRRRIEG